MITRRQLLGTSAAAPAALPLLGVDDDRAGQVHAMEAVLSAAPAAEADPERPIYHFRPPANWTNDPNGTFFHRAWHHLFYQLNPFAASIGNQHWGHARSRDLVNWEHLPVALWPSTSKGEKALYSGGAIIAKDGRPRILYTSIGHPQPEQWLAIPKDEDCLEWEKFAGNPVLTADAHGKLQVDQWRDPFLFTEDGRTYMVCGGNTPVYRRGGEGAVQLYQAQDEALTKWTHLGVVFRYRDRGTFNIECPNLFKLDGRWVLIVSPHRPCEYFIGELDLKRVRFLPEEHGVLDPGSAYASNISVDDRGRTILWLWGRTNTQPGKGWNGVIVMPRILSIGPDGFLRQQVPEEFSSLRGAAVTVPPAVLGETPLVVESIRGDALEIEAEFSAGSAGGYGLQLRRAESGAAGLVVAVRRGTLFVGNTQTYIGTAERCRLRVFLDKRVAEVYVDGGLAAVFTTVDAAPTDLGVAAFAQPPSVGRGGQPGPLGNSPLRPARLESMTIWPMKPARMSMDRFRT
ncbi:MAG: glycoside hydrolase family 32 protein [Bryobacteraceae bacterium]